MPTNKYYYAIGRRKTATVIIKMFKGKQAEQPITINGLPINVYWPTEAAKTVYQEPFKTTNTLSRFTATATAKGSGKNGQLGAFVLAAARALEKFDQKLRPVLKKRGLLTRDQRQKERRKPGLAQKARAKKQSPKR